MWPELYPTCTPWFLSPANGVEMLGNTIVHISDEDVQCQKSRTRSREIRQHLLLCIRLDAMAGLGWRFS
jgi:hypothetical protein